MATVTFDSTNAPATNRPGTNHIDIDTRSWKFRRRSGSSAARRAHTCPDGAASRIGESAMTQP